MAAKDHNALGLIETRGLVAAIEAADAMAKAADVRILGVENTVAAYMTVQVSGETSARQAAVAAGVIAAARGGEVQQDPAGGQEGIVKVVGVGVR